MKIIALDTETTGLDLYHSARPYFVTIAKPQQLPINYEWEVDPQTREVIIPQKAKDEIRAEIENADLIVGQNFKFDVTALVVAGIIKEMDWSKVRDTLIAGHVLASNQKHSLDAMIAMYLGENIRPLEIELEKACTQARRIARTRYKTWKIAKPGQEGMPSLKQSSKKEEEKGWKYDSWLPKLLAEREGYPENHSWYTVTNRYASADSVGTLSLYFYMERELKRMGLWEIYLQRLKLLEVYYEMEKRGVSYSLERLTENGNLYQTESDTRNRICTNIAKTYNYKLELPNGATNKSLMTFCFGEKFNNENGGIKDKRYLDLPIIECTDKGNPAFDKYVLSTYQNTLPRNSKQLAFIENLLDKREYDTALGFVRSYKKFGVPAYLDGCEGKGYELEGWRILHPSQNPTGTDTLRGSCSNPNAQQCSKRSKANLRKALGPLPNREWYSLDAQNIELRIPAFYAPEPLLIDVFNNPKKPPYYGSYHLVVFDTLHPELFRKHGKDVKDLFEDTWYQWVKNGNFAVIYGAQEKKADETYHVKGAYQKIRYRFPNIAKLNDRMIALAKRQGFVETIPDKLVNPLKGYPIWCARTEYNEIMPTTPLNYFVQSTACWLKQVAMVEAYKELKDMREHDRTFDGYIILDVHDELVFDFPKSKVHPLEALEIEKKAAEKGDRMYGFFERIQSNLWKIRRIQKIMESCGDRIGIPIPFGVEYNEHNWAEMVKL